VATASEHGFAQPRGINVSEMEVAKTSNMVGPVMRQGELAVAVCEAAQQDNPGKTISVDDKLAYLRIQTEDEMILRRQTIEELLQAIQAQSAGDRPCVLLRARRDESRVRPLLFCQTSLIASRDWKNHE
jgi:hypothetical protein